MDRSILEQLMHSTGQPPPLADELRANGADPVLPTRFRIGEAASAALLACAAATHDLWELRTGRRQRADIDVRAATAALISFLHLRGSDSGLLLRDSVAVTNFYPTKGDDWIHLHGGFPHLRDGILSLLGCGNDPIAIAARVREWDAQELEDTLADLRLCGARAREHHEWLAHPQAKALAMRPLVDIERIGDHPREPLPEGTRPLSGIRVLDLTRVLAGPTCGRTLAEHGADVLRVHAPHLPSIEPFVMDTGHGKLSTHLDLRTEQDAARFRELVRTGDIVTRGYRGGSLERYGAGLEDLLDLRPGLIVVSINCYGHDGPWRDRAGWEQLAQTVTGISCEQGGERPQLLPAAAMDYTTGYLAALGALVALKRRAVEGGSFHVRVSLARTAMWLLDLPRVDGTPCGFDEDFLAPYLLSSPTESGEIRHLGPVLKLSETSPTWKRPTVPLGTHVPQWPPRFS